MMTMWCFELRRISDGSTYSASIISSMMRATMVRRMTATLSGAPSTTRLLAGTKADGGAKRLAEEDFLSLWVKILLFCLVWIYLNFSSEKVCSLIFIAESILADQHLFIENKTGTHTYNNYSTCSPKKYYSKTSAHPKKYYSKTSAQMWLTIFDWRRWEGGGEGKER